MVMQRIANPSSRIGMHWFESSTLRHQVKITSLYSWLSFFYNSYRRIDMEAGGAIVLAYVLLIIFVLAIIYFVIQVPIYIAKTRGIKGLIVKVWGRE